MQGYLLDTNMISFMMRDRSAAARQRAEAMTEQASLLLSAICEAELRRGLARGGSDKLKDTFNSLTSTFHRIPFDMSAAESYARLDSWMRAAGLSLSLADKLIAAHALALGATLVTHDHALHRLKPFLSVEDWATDMQ